MNMLNTLAFVGLLACLGGCTSFRTMETATDDPAEVTQALEPGDRVRITTATGWKVEMNVTAVGPDSVSGTLPGKDEELVEIPLAEIVELQVEEVDAVRTGAVVVGSGVVIYWILGAMATVLILGGA